LAEKLRLDAPISFSKG